MILHLPHAFFHIFVIDIVKPHFFDPITRLYRPALRMHEKAAKAKKRRNAYVLFPRWL